MRLEELDRYGIPKRVIENWRQRQGETLLSVQKRAIRAGLLGQPGSSADGGMRMIIAAPTSSGKSFCAELVAAKALAERRKVALLFPLKSLAEEKYRIFEALFGGLGVKCLIATGDRSENDEAFLRGDYQLAVSIYEKFDLLLTTELDALANIGLVVVDELQMLGVPRRGAVLERLLTRINSSTYRPSLVGLSAVLGGDSLTKLGEWLGATVVEEAVRPVDLLVGVAAEKSIRFRSFNTGAVTNTACPFGETVDGMIDGLIDQIKQTEGSTLVFLKSRQNTVDLAFRLAASASFPPAKTALEELSAEEPSFLVRSLSQAMSRGVAFHNSDLSPRQRRIVEEAFTRGEVRVLVATTTLAMGVNLPVDTVYLETVKFVVGAYDDRASLAPISRAEFENMCGRAGRLGLNADGPGKAIVLAGSEFDRDILWESYVAFADSQDSERLSSAFDSLPPEDWALGMCVCGLATSESDLKNLYARTLHARLQGDTHLDWAAVVRALERRGCIRSDGDDNTLIVTPRGRAVAITGLSVRQAAKLRTQVARRSPESEFGWLALALSAPDWPLVPGMLTRIEHRQNLPVKMLYQRFDHSVEEAVPLLPENHRRQPLSYRLSASLKGLLLLEDWRRLVPVQKLEERYQLHLGQILSLGETAAHLCRGLASLIEADDLDNPNVPLLRDLAFSVRHGLPPKLADLHRAVGEILTRADMLALQTDGLDSVSALAGLSQERLAQLIKDKNRAARLTMKLCDIQEEVDMKTMTLNSQTIGFTPELVEIDGSCEHDRYLVKINGFPVRLTGKSFKYFAKLAWWRRQQPAGWVYKDDIEIGFNQARYLYRMKNEINAELRADWPIIENNRLGYYRLDIDPGRIQINVENLKSHPDYEIRSLTTVQ
ncbi:MAG: DEAD/DEAH box helicase [candidate division Zixibacteria bacterium]|nr:DEAD/DEAH box helicase [candidate division Zixibacteria bacterium]